ncbi:MAG: response regulator transcription factor [Elusimicrobiota bacterium]|nr:response regulator transcription factor [Elusimicrobiota bacterium]
MKKYKILVIDDDENILSLITDILEKEGFLVITSTNTEDGFKKAVNSQPDIIITDVSLPNIGGIELTRMLKSDKKTKHIPVIMLTVLSSETDKVIGLEVGADDYITKPFSQKELVARIKSLLRLKETLQQKYQPRILKLNDLEVNLDEHKVTVKDKIVHLTPKEFDLLVLFLEKPNILLTREFILETVFNYKVNIQTRTIDTHIKNLRKKISPYGKHIKTIHSQGYKFVP